MSNFTAMKRFHLFLAALMASTFLYAQKRTEKWYWAGSPAPAVDFTPATPVALGNNAMTFCHESGTSIADLNGNLLFYADGNAVVFNRNHVAMTNGTALVMHNSVAQGCIIIPKPGSTNLYYLFHIGVPNLGSPPYNLYYSEIDMNLSGGLGAVTASKNVLIGSSNGSTAEKLTAVQHCNGTDVWVVVHSYTGNTYRAYLVTAAGVNGTPVTSSVGTQFLPANADWMGQMKISPSGTKIATAAYDQGIVDVCDFNAATGVVSNPISLVSGGTWVYGIEFSPDNTKLYGSVTSSPPSLVQWDLCAGNSAAIAASKTAISNNAYVYSMQMANNGKVYCANATTYLGVINNPNVAGVGANYNPNGVNVAPGNSWLGLPNFISSYFDTPANKPQATVTPVNSGSCGCTGSATADICMVFGAAPYTFVWSNGTTTGPTTGLSSTISNLCPGTYSVVVNDATCRADTAVFSISSSGNSFTVTPTVTPATCGSNNGAASVSITGGTSPFTYSWNPGGQTTSAVTGLTVGNYTVTITDATNCTSTQVVNVTGANNPTVTVTPQNVVCNGGNNGSASASIASSNPPYTYNWSNGQTTSAITGLSPGFYSVTVTDGTGCSGTQSFTITQPAAITSGIMASMTNCGMSTGQGFMGTSGGNPPFTYLWSNGQTTSSATGLAAGNYTCVATDAGGCTTTATVTIFNANGPAGSIASQTPATCSGASNGTATGTATGGSAPYTFIWSNGQTTTTVTGLAAGTYSCIVADAGGCTNVMNVTIVNGAGPSALINSSTQPSCFGGNDGTATASASGGTAPYSYLWNNGQSSATATSLSAGTYSVTLTDAGGCTAQQSITIGQPSAITLLTTSTPAACGMSNGTANAIASGGSPTFSYSWISGPVGPNITGLAAGTYTVLVADSKGCTQTQSVTVASLPGPTASIGSDVTIQTGTSTTLSVSGGVSYSWYPSGGLSSSTVANPVATPSATTQFCVYVMDAGGCADSACMTVYVKEPCGSFYLPNAFSPNGDLENDGYKAHIRAECVKDFHMSIYDRWGERVFQTSDVLEAWDGTWRGTVSNPAVYAVVCDVTFTDGTKLHKELNVSLVR